MVNKCVKVHMTFIGNLDDLQFLTDVVSVKMVSPSKILLETTHCAHHALNELHSLNYIHEERRQNIFLKNFLKALGCFYMYEKHQELCVRPILFEKEMFVGLLA